MWISLFFTYLEKAYFTSEENFPRWKSAKIPRPSRDPSGENQLMKQQDFFQSNFIPNVEIR